MPFGPAAPPPGRAGSTGCLQLGHQWNAARRASRGPNLPPSAFDSAAVLIVEAIAVGFRLLFASGLAATRPAGTQREIHLAAAPVFAPFRPCGAARERLAATFAGSRSLDLHQTAHEAGRAGLGLPAGCGHAVLTSRRPSDR